MIPLAALTESSVLQDPVQALLLFKVYLIVVFALVSMLYLKHLKIEDTIATTYVLGGTAFIFIVFGTGVLGYEIPFPGLILSAGFSVVVFVLGYGVGSAANRNKSHH